MAAQLLQPSAPAWQGGGGSHTMNSKGSGTPTTVPGNVAVEGGTKQTGDPAGTQHYSAVF
jgi:hypothetical protein